MLHIKQKEGPRMMLPRPVCVCEKESEKIDLIEN